VNGVNTQMLAIPRTRKIRRARISTAIAARAAAFAIFAVLSSASPATAGQYTVTFNANANQPPGCGIWTISGSTTFAYNPPCSTSPLGFSGGGNGSSMPAGARIGMQTNAPAGVAITSAFVSPWYIYDLNNNMGWGGGSYYAGGGSQWHDSDTQEQDGSFSSSYWGFQMICGWSSCKNFGGIFVNSIQLTGTENQGPALTAVGGNNLWYQGGHWIWNPPGDPWSIALSGSDPSGVCQMWAVLNNVQINSPGQTPDTAVWQQCPDWTWNPTADTRVYVPASGSLSLTLAGSNVAGVASAPSETLQVDNQPVQLSLSGPTLASTTGGTQYITASASAGPSGVAIGCSVDGGPEQWQNASSTQTPVAGAGEHVVSCRAHNGAIGPQGQYAYSSTQSWSLNIGQPTVSAIGFQKIVNALKCAPARERVTVPARWVSVHRHHKLVKVRKPARTKTVTVQRCHARVVWQRRTVWVKVRRHGKLTSVKRTKRVRVPLIPHTVMKTKKEVSYGHGTTVSGWLGTASGVAIGGVPVEILTAPNNGQGQFTAAVSATSAANGSWSAQLGPGPSRLVEAVYGGSAGLLPVTSTPVELNVPARISLAATPRILPWSRVVTLRGHLDGGYVPADGVALRLLIELPGRAHPYEPVPFRTDAQGNFVVHWSWGTGSGVVTYPFAVATTATESDYAFAASRSRWIRVTFGLPTPRANARHRHHHRAKRHRAKHRRKR
jgi:hypothetical protein